MHQCGVLQQQAAHSRHGEKNQRPPCEPTVGRRVKVARLPWHRVGQKGGEAARRDNCEGGDERGFAEEDPTGAQPVPFVQKDVDEQQPADHNADEDPERSRWQDLVSQRVWRDWRRRRTDLRPDDADDACANEQDPKDVPTQELLLEDRRRDTVEDDRQATKSVTSVAARSRAGGLKAAAALDKPTHQSGSVRKLTLA